MPLLNQSNDLTSPNLIREYNPLSQGAPHHASDRSLNERSTGRQVSTGQHTLLLRNTHRVILAESIEGSNASKNAADSKPFLLKGRNDGALRPPKSAAVWGFKTGPRMTKRRETSLERSARKGTARHLPSFLDIGQHRRDETATYPHGPLVGVKPVSYTHLTLPTILLV
eukprot:9486329-Pyramimonas_sp.AAC.1